MERALRPRGPVQYVGPHEDDPMVARKYDVRKKFQEYAKDHGFVSHLREEDFTLQYVQENGFQRPLVFKDAAALGLKVPPASLTVSDVKTLVGARRQVDVMDLHTQETHTMTMHHWAKYYESRPRHKILNVISLEFSRTKLDPLVQPPTLVRQLDWVELMWPQELKNAQTNPTNDMHKMMYPKVQKYCLMSVTGCYTDFHLDFGGTSVWYHVLRGEKQFLLIPPSPENYATFQLWQLDGQQEVVFLGDLVPQCQLVRLRAGDTFIMPAGWIHAVYTPVDSLVFGGNFLHSFNIDQQMRVAEVEKTTRVPVRLQYPFYGAIHWYTLLRYNQELQHRRVEGSAVNCDVGKSSSGNTCSQRWLRSVCVPRLILQSFSNRRWLKCVLVERLPLSTSTGKENKGEPQSGRVHSCPAKPHLSCYEQKGLLTLVQAMRQDSLFSQDVPYCISHPLHLLDTLEAQLRSPSLASACSPVPTGIALILPPPTHERKRAEKRKRRPTGYHRRKRAKLHKNSSCAVESAAISEPGTAPNPRFEDQWLLADENEVSCEVVCEETQAEDLGNTVPDNVVEDMCTETTVLSMDQGDIVETAHTPTDICSPEVQGELGTAETLHPSRCCSSTREEAHDSQHLQNTIPPSSPASQPSSLPSQPSSSIPPPPSSLTSPSPSSPALPPPPSSPALPPPPSSPALPPPPSSPALPPPPSSLTSPSPSSPALPPPPSSPALPPPPSSLTSPSPSSPALPPPPSSPALPPPPSSLTSPSPSSPALPPPPSSPALPPPLPSSPAPPPSSLLQCSSPPPPPPSSPPPLPPSSSTPPPPSSPPPLPPSSSTPPPPSSPPPLPPSFSMPPPPSFPPPLPPSFSTPPSSSPAPLPPSSPMLSAVFPVPRPTNSQPIQFGPPIQMDLLSFLALANATKSLYHQTHQLPRPTLCLPWGTTGETVPDSSATRRRRRTVSSERTRRQTQTNSRRKCVRPRQYLRPASHPSTSNSQSHADTVVIDGSTPRTPPPLLLSAGEFLSRHAEWAAGPPVEPLCSQLTADVLLSPEDPMLSRSHDLPLSGVTTPTKGLREEGDGSGKGESPVCFTDDLKTELESLGYEGVTDVAFSRSSSVSPSPLRCPPCARNLLTDPLLHSLCVSHEVNTSNSF